MQLTPVSDEMSGSAPRRPEGRLGTEVPEIPHDMIPALRSDHAGETGAVFIYKGILAVSRDTSVRAFANRHLETERRHLQVMERMLAAKDRSRLLTAWRLAGWVTGALPALFGAAAVYRTIDAMESFVDRHYAEQMHIYLNAAFSVRLDQRLEFLQPTLTKNLVET